MAESGLKLRHSAAREYDLACTTNLPPKVIKPIFIKHLLYPSIVLCTFLSVCPCIQATTEETDASVSLGSQMCSPGPQTLKGLAQRHTCAGCQSQEWKDFTSNSQLLWPCLLH